MLDAQQLFSGEKLGSCYVSRCLVTGLPYYGITMEENPEDRIKGHINDAKKGSHLDFHKAIREHGEENFVWCWLHYKSLPKRKLELYERFYILANDAIENGYNMHPGGGGFMEHTEESKQKLSKIMSKIMSEKSANGQHPMHDPEVVSRQSKAVSKTMKDKADRGELWMQNQADRGELWTKTPEWQESHSKTMKDKGDRGEHPNQQPEARERFSKNNPMHNPESVAKMVATQRRNRERKRREKEEQAGQIYFLDENL